MITAYDKAIAAFLASGLGLLTAFGLNLPWLNPTVVAAITPFVAMLATFAVPNKQPTAEVEQGAYQATSPGSPGPNPSAGRMGLKLAFTGILLVAFVLPALAADLGRKGKIAAPAAPAEPAGPAWSPPPLQDLAPPQGQWYLGAFGSYDWTRIEGDSEGSWAPGILGGYMGKWGAVGAGFEIDAQRTIEDKPRGGDELDLWRFTARLRAGYFPTQNALLYGTAGWAWQGRDENAFVYGAGVELAATQNVSVRLEYLRFEFEQPANAIRAGLAYRF